MIPQSDDLRVQHSCHDVVVVMRDVSEQDNVAHKLGDDHSKSKKGEQSNGLLLPGGSKLQSSIGSFFSTLYISTESIKPLTFLSNCDQEVKFQAVLKATMTGVIHLVWK